MAQIQGQGLHLINSKIYIALTAERMGSDKDLDTVHSSVPVKSEKSILEWPQRSFIMGFFFFFTFGEQRTCLRLESESLGLGDINLKTNL